MRARKVREDVTGMVPGRFGEGLEGALGRSRDGLGKDWVALGEGPGTVWGRSVFSLGTFTTFSATQITGSHFSRGRSTPFFRTVPKSFRGLPYPLALLAR